tara:strand:+ start:485 stop:730 length:246 start_codon:yes stop_codon:yes gene_type:complete
MFEFCPIVEKMCPMCSKDKWNPYINDYDDEERLFCGAATSFDTRVEALDMCWLDMKKSQQTKFTKEKRIEYQILRETGGFK